METAVTTQQFNLVPGAKVAVEIKVGESTLQLVEAAGVLAEKAVGYYKITDQPHAELTAEFRARLNQTIKSLDEERLEMGRGARETLEKINARFNEKIAPMKQMLQKVDAGLLEWSAAQRRAAEEAQRAAAKEAEDAARAAAAEAEARGETPPPIVAEAFIPTPVATPAKITGTHGSRVGTREVWKWRVVEFGKVPKKFRRPPEECVDAATLTAMARSQKDQASVPGIEFYKDEAITSRVVS